MISRNSVKGGLTVVEKKAPVPVPVQVRSSQPRDRWVTGPQKTLEMLRSRSREIGDQIEALLDEKARLDEAISVLEAGSEG